LLPTLGPVVINYISNSFGFHGNGRMKIDNIKTDSALFTLMNITEFVNKELIVIIVIIIIIIPELG
jgi:hypothetical protein